MVMGRILRCNMLGMKEIWKSYKHLETDCWVRRAGEEGKGECGTDSDGGYVHSRTMCERLPTCVVGQMKK